MSQLSLFDIDPRAGDPGLTHVLMPNMAYACGGSILTTAGHFTVGPNPWDKVTCPACVALGYEALSIEVQAQQGRQADVAL